MFRFEWPPKHIPGFEAALRDIKSKSAQFRRNAAVSLGRADDEQREEAVKAVEVLLDDEAAEVRLEALIAAIRLKPESLTKRIAGFLDSQNPDERVAALDFLSRIGDRGYWERVKGILRREKEPDVRCMALETLSYLNPEECRRMVIEELEAADDLESHYLRKSIVVLSEIGELRDLNILPRFLSHHSIGVRIETAHILAMMDMVQQEELMAAVLLDTAELVRDRSLRELALEGLCRLGTDRIAETARRKFRKIFMSKQEKIYWAAICSSRGDKKATEYLKRIYNGKNVPAAAKVLWAAGLCGIRDWLPVMENNVQMVLDGRQDRFLYDSISAIGKLCTEESVGTLRRFKKKFQGFQPDIAEFIEGELEVSERLLQAKNERPLDGE